MGKLIVFNFVTLNGFFKGPNGDISWHKHGGEENEYSSEMLKTGSTLLFGRVTYEMMAGFWPSQDAIKHNPVVANGMNSADKIVFSKTLNKADWNKTTVINENIVEEVKRLKQTLSTDMALLGSGSILTQFAEVGIIDEYQIMVDPVAIGEGTPIFKGMKTQLELKLTKTRTFESGVVLLCYEKK